MAYSNLFMPSGFPRAPLANGIGRYVCQLQRVTLKFCKSHGSSQGIREFIENDLINFAKTNPGIVVYVKPRRHRDPFLQAEFLTGENRRVCVRNMKREEVSQWLHILRTQSGISELRLRKHWFTEYPSIQGPWSPFTNMKPEFNLLEFPNEELSKPLHVEKSATEKILELYNLQISSGKEIDITNPKETNES